MSSQPASEPGMGSAAAGAGLCDSCRHRIEVRNTRGSVFSLCGRSRTEDAFSRYPRLPVLECGGYERRDPAGK